MGVVPLDRVVDVLTAHECAPRVELVQVDLSVRSSRYWLLARMKSGYVKRIASTGSWSSSIALTVGIGTTAPRPKPRGRDGLSIFREYSGSRTRRIQRRESELHALAKRAS